MAFSTDEKLELIHELWESVAEDDLEVSEEEKRLLDDRWANYLANPDSALTLEQVKALVAARLARE